MFTECKSTIENILGVSIDGFADEGLIAVLKEISFDDEDLKRTLANCIGKIEQLMNSPVEELRKYKSEKETKLNSLLRPKEATRYFNAAAYDHLSPTMYAYYFCDKSKSILTDKVAAEMTLLQGESKVVFEEEIKPKLKKGDSHNEIENPSMRNQSRNDLGRKRERNNASNSKTKRINNKRTNANNRKKSLEDDDSAGNTRKKLKADAADSDDEEDKEYCIKNCLIGRKYAGNNMIECDGCGSWYHCKCIMMTDDEFQTIGSNNITWNCEDCDKK